MAPRCPVAVVGIGCRFPGGVDSPATFWDALVRGVDGIGPLPPGRFDAADYVHPTPRTPGKMVTAEGGFLPEVDAFDAEFFGISPREADKLDPQHRLLLEVAWEALEDAGQPLHRLEGSSTGVFVGLWLQDYETRLFRDPARVDFYDTTGTGRYAASGRISHAFGLQGPAITIDTACSSSLVAIHQACRSLQTQDCSLALAGGANVVLLPHITLAYSRSGMMAPDGRCKFGDARADGYVRSDGAGIVALKRLDDALADGDPIYAVVAGGAVNNDGRSGDHFVTPSQAGQEQMLRLAWTDAGLDPRGAAYVEAHGTGTSAGDPVELGAIGSVIGAGRPDGGSCLVGSVKTNFGHTEGAAGVAGFIKTALVLERGAVPPSLHLSEPNPAIPWSELGVHIPTTPTPLPDQAAVRTAGVSSFGIAGTNAHVVLSEHAARATTGNQAEGLGAGTDQPFVVAPLSAHTPHGLAERARRLLGRIVGAEDDELRLSDLAHTLGARRTWLPHRTAPVVDSIEALVAELESISEGRVASTAPVDKPTRIVFVFPGQGSQWIGMGRRLAATEPAFEEALRECEESMAGLVDWSLAEELARDEDDPDYALDRIDIVQPALVALDIALARLWRSWGVEPSAVVGHSMGEVAAAHVAGALTLPDAMRIICERSRLLLRISGRGGMAVVELPRAEAEAMIAGKQGDLSVAAANSPRSTVVAGDPAALDDLLTELEDREIFGRRIAVDVASHSAQVDELLDDLLAVLEDLRPGETSVPFVSTVEGAVIEGSRLGPDYWSRNLRRPVLFADALDVLAGEAAAAGAVPILLEVSPHPVLVPAMEQALGPSGGVAVGSLRRGEDEARTIREAAARLWIAGGRIDFGRLLAVEARVLRLPGYPWERRRHWVDDDEGIALRRGGGHPVLGRPVRSPAGFDLYEGSLDLERLPFLTDHRVRGRVVVPAAAMLEMAMSAAQSMGEDVAVEDVRFDAMLEVERDGRRVVQLALETESADSASFQIHARDGHADDAWTLHARGRLIAGAEPPAAPDTVVDGGPSADSDVDHYQMMTDLGLEYGPAFQGVERLALGNERSVARIRLPVAIEGEAGFAVHPVLLDAVLQVGLAAVRRARGRSGTLVPVSIRRIHSVGAPLPTQGTVVATVEDEAAELVLIDDAGTVRLVVEDLRFQPLAATPEDAMPTAYEVVWEPTEAGVPRQRSPVDRWLVLGEGPAADEVQRALLDDGVEVTAVADRWDADEVRTWLDEAPGDGGRAIALLAPDGAAEPDASAAETPAEAVLGAIGPVVEGHAPSVDELWVVTRNAQNVVAGDTVTGLAQATLWGFGAVLAQELPRTRVRVADTDEVSVPVLADDMRHSGDDDRIAYRDGVRHVARLVVRDQAPETAREAAIPKPAYRVVSERPGVIESLAVVAVPRVRPGPRQVEIEIRAAGLNFLNVLSALGTCPGFESGVGPMGIECSGVVSRVGDDVSGFSVGDRVAAFAHDSLGSHVVVPADLIVPIPDELSHDEAATVPIAYLTAHHALEHLARLEAGERVLIHSASGGVGLAAVHLARRIGARILATAGREEKRDWLRERGIEHVFDSRSLSFAREVLEVTGGEGVDVVVNSLSGEAIRKGLEILRPYGRFVELGKRDIYGEGRLDLGPFRRNLSYYAVDLERAARERPERVAGALSELARRLADGELDALPFTSYPVTDAVEAFRTMAAARHVGKIVLATPPPDAIADRIVTREIVLREDATYLVTGGTGALGLEVAEWAVGRGAGTLVLMGRSAPSEPARKTIEGLVRRGCRVVVEQADVADRRAVGEVVDRIHSDLPPLRGVVHAAGLLADATLATMDVETFRRPLVPKVPGSWVLHTVTRDLELDFFVLFSSVAGVIGTPGQANYAAGNAFMDALAAFRVRRGLPASSIAWGPWSDVGLAASRADRGARLEVQGLTPLTPRQGLVALGRIIQDRVTHSVVGDIDAAAWRSAHPAAARSPFLERLAPDPDGGGVADGPGHGIRHDLVSAGRDERAGLLRTYLRDRLAEVLRLSPESVRNAVPFKRLGVDSLMSLELRNRLEADLCVPVSATSIWNYPTVEQLTEHLLTRVDEDGPTSEPRPAASATTGREAAELEALSQDDLEDLLDQELAASEDLLGKEGS